MFSKMRRFVCCREDFNHLNARNARMDRCKSSKRMESGLDTNVSSDKNYIMKRGSLVSDALQYYT